jgi:ankyrin repeat protein
MNNAINNKKNISSDDINNFLENLDTIENQYNKNQKSKYVVNLSETTSSKLGHNTPLHYAARYATSAKEIKTIIRKGYKINSVDDNLYTPLMLAARYNKHIGVIKTLLKAGATLNSFDKYKKNAIQLALESNPSNRIVMELLQTQKLPKNKFKQTALMIAAMSNPSSSVIEALIKNGEDVNAKDTNGFTPLMYAAASNTHPSIIKTLIKNGADINITAIQGLTALHIAAGASWIMYKLNCLDKEREYYASNPNAVKALLEHTSNINVKDEDNNTPLLHAIIHQAWVKRKFSKNPPLSKNKTTIKQLLKHNANVNSTDKKGMSPLMHYIYSEPEADVVKLLLKAGADVNLKTQKGETAMSFTREIHTAFHWDFPKEQWRWKKYNIAAKLMEKYIK